MTDDSTEPTQTKSKESPAGQHRSGDAQRPDDHLDKDQPNRETIPRKSSLL